MSVVDSVSDYILWIRINELLISTVEYVILGSIYLLPGDSRFNTQDELGMFEVKISNMCILYNFVLLTGDFNARTNTQHDFIDADDFLTDHFEFVSTLEKLYSISSVLPECNLDKIPCSHDNFVNNEDRLLLETCKNNNLFFKWKMW